jgi:hypothetical protein
MNQPIVKHYDTAMDIRNLAQLAHGTGARYLEVMESHIRNVYIAVQWRNKCDNPYNGNVRIPNDHILIQF